MIVDEKQHPANPSTDVLNHSKSQKKYEPVLSSVSEMIDQLPLNRRAFILGKIFNLISQEMNIGSELTIFD